MANPGAPQNQLGQLYIDLGAKGAKGLIGQLGKITLGMFAAKKATDLFTKPIKQMWKETGSNTVQLKKLSTQLGATFQDVHKLRMYLNEKGLSEGLIDDLGGLQDKLYDITHGFAGMDAAMARTINLLGLDISKYDGSLESTIQLVNDVKKATQGMSELDVAQMFKGLGLSKEFAFAIQQGDFDLSGYKSISDKQVQDNLKFQQELNKIKNEWGTEMMKLGSNLLPTLTPLLKSIATHLPTFSSALENFVTKGVPAIEKLVEKLSKFLGDTAEGKNTEKIKTAATAATVGVATAPLGIPVAAGAAGIAAITADQVNKIKKSNGTYTGEAYGGAQFSIKDEDTLPYKINQWRNKNKGVTTGQASPIDFTPQALQMNSPLDALPSQTKNSMMQNINVTINNENNITSPSPEAAARRISEIDENSLTISLIKQQKFQQVTAL